MKGGSSDYAAAKATDAVMRAGATRLEAAVTGTIAGYGETCFVPDRVLQEQILRPDGERYHLESIGRARRNAARQGWLHSKRIVPGQTPRGARWPSAHGVAEKWVLWGNLGLKNPTTPRDRARARAQQQATQRAYEAAAAPKHSAPVRMPAPTPPLPPELACIAARIGDRIEQREQRREQAHDAAQVLAAVRGPPT